ncbi:hypothetical protein WBG78_27845 [Chryseolinea sp. T2]|uniref:hypothetical protein n=1 Tax=Chryseolinea sp. T2 TaxID=3129255 RepID=UPI0030771137
MQSNTTKKNEVITACLLSALAFGTAWAVRGKFGHEQGAAWAGGIGAMGVILVAKRADWYNRMWEIVLASAFGWGLSGMISYGAVVGYARADDFINIFYGLSMLFVIGSLYGFLGGGLFALSLSDTKEDRVPWAVLLTEMLAFGLLTYGLLINQLGWLMTPPRSELWAACLGACIPVGWYAFRTNKRQVLRVAIWSALGSGWGFAFGNFLQVMANAVNFPMNPWNIMEYSIGFFGGLGMCYSTLTSTWPVLEVRTSGANKIAAALVLIVIPFVVWDQSFNPKQLDHILKLGGTESLITVFQWIAIITITLMAVALWRTVSKKVTDYSTVQRTFVLFAGAYILLSFLLTGIAVHPVEQYLYLVNVAVILIVAARMHSPFTTRNEPATTWLVTAMSAVAVIALLTLVVLTCNPKMLDTVGRF